MIWTWTTQSALKYTVTLRDSSGVYINSATRQSTNPLPTISNGAQINGDNLSLIVDCQNALSAVPTLQAILDPTGKPVGYQFLLVAEDSTDQDYNDIMFSIVSFARKG